MLHCLELIIINMAPKPNTSMRLPEINMLYIVLFYLLFGFDYGFCATHYTSAGNPPSNLPVSIRPGNVYYVNNSQQVEILTTFCWNGDTKSLLALWKTATVYLSIDDENFSIYKGENATHVVYLHQMLQQSWFSILPWREKSISLSPFNTSCVGVFSKSEYALRLDLRYLNFNRLVMFASGMALFVIAPVLCERVVFHYTTGTLVGVLGSVLIVIYLVSRLIPKKSGAYAVMIGGASVVTYLMRTLWENFYVVLREYQLYVFAYLLTSSVVSFCICYRFGPVTNPKTRNLLQWGLQMCGLVFIFVSSEHREGIMSVILATLIVHNFPRALWAKFQTLWLTRFPPKTRLLTEEEYFDQGRIETQKALDELRCFSRSPNCNAWKTMSKLRDPLSTIRDRSRSRSNSRFIEFSSVKSKAVASRKRSRFAEFVEGKSHLSDNEILDYETTTLITPDSLTDDESDED